MLKQDNVKITNMDDLAPLIIEAIQNQCDVKLTVTGNSMYPLLRHGMDCVLLTGIKKIRKYDIPLYRRENGTYVLHRVVRKKGDVLCLSGDHELVIEQPIYASQLIAVVKGIYRNNQYISCNNLWYRLYCILWVWILPHRVKVIRLLKALRRKLRAK